MRARCKRVAWGLLFALAFWPAAGLAQAGSLVIGPQDSYDLSRAFIDWAH